MANNSTLYSYCSPLSVGCPVWANIKRTSTASNGIYSTFDYLTQGTRYITVYNGVISSIDNLCPVGPGSVIATQYGYGTGIIEVSRGENSVIMTPFHTIGKDWIEAKASTDGVYIYAIRNLVVPEAAGKIEKSSNYGASFYPITSGITPTHNPVAIAMDETADTVVVVTQNGYIYYNLSRYNSSFTAATAPGIRNWKAVAVSATGNIIFAAASDGTVWRTTRSQINSSQGWLQCNIGYGGGSTSWTCITMNRNGSRIWLAGNNTHLYISDDGYTFIPVQITVTIPNIGSVSSPFNFSNIATDNLGNNTVATVEPSSNSEQTSFIVKNFIGGSVNYSNWSWGWGRSIYYPYNNVVNGSWTGLAVSSDATTVYAVNNDPSSGGLYFSTDQASNFSFAGGSKNYSSISYVRNQTCPANGTVLEQFCDGTTWTQIIANGSCSTYTTQEYNSPLCPIMENYVCDCGFGCEAYPNPCYYYGCYDCNGGVV
jgi:hypothetical protein